MPRRPRISLSGIPHHIIQRGNNSSACFYSNADYQCYLDWLAAYAEKYHCRIHAYVLMTNHVHLLVTPATTQGVSHLMKRLGQRYVQYINRTYQRSGTLWEGRFRSCLVNEEHYLLGCYRYIELNPVRAGMVAHPAAYRWCSYRANAQGEHIEWLEAHPLYHALGHTPAARQMAYRELFKDQLASGLVDQIRHATNGNYALGSDQFRQAAAAVLGRRVSPGLPGRPRKEVKKG